MENLADHSNSKLFSVLCCYIPIQKEILYIEEVRALCKSNNFEVGYRYYDWLNSMEEYRYNCYDDCFWNLFKFLDKSNNSFDLFSKLICSAKVFSH